jgi:prolyl oligopeptidase
LAPVSIEPGPRESVAGVSATRDKLLIGIYQNVKGKVLVATRAPNNSWSHTAMTLPDNVSTNVVSTDTKTNDALVSVTGF